MYHKLNTTAENQNKLLTKGNTYFNMNMAIYLPIVKE